MTKRFVPERQAATWSVGTVGTIIPRSCVRCGERIPIGAIYYRVSSLDSAHPAGDYHQACFPEMLREVREARRVEA